jgi:uncharacterized membrane protein YgaE (UPF0421/DUF939 family)
VASEAAEERGERPSRERRLARHHSGLVNVYRDHRPGVRARGDRQPPDAFDRGERSHDRLALVDGWRSTTPRSWSERSAKLGVMPRHGTTTLLRSQAANAWPALQGAGAATVAWALARQLGGPHDPFFAPIAAFVALNAPLGERGLNAIRLLLGVFVGIAVGEAAILAIGGTYAALALSTFAAALAARTLGGSRIIVAQAAISAILVVALADGEAGLYRLGDALIGAVVALAFSQLLFSPEPVRLLRRAEGAALTDLAKSLELTARALEHDDDELGEQALDRLRSMRDRMTELSRVRSASSRVARRSAVWRSQRAPVVRETENAGHLDLLAGSSVTFARAALGASAPARQWLTPRAHDLARTLADLAREPGERAARQQAADRALDIARRLADSDSAPDATLAAAIATGRMVAADLMAFAGVDPDQAAGAVREGTGRFDVPTPASTPRAPFGVSGERTRRMRAPERLRAAARRLRRRAAP